jgi:predicted Ser/Thr protein kinase
MRCSKCETEISSATRFCPNCGTSMDTERTRSGSTATPAPHSTPTPDEGRFPAGTILGERFRVLGLLGKGGMGEVYRAHDTKLEQQVALKFLPRTATRDRELLERFRGEVRIARQISHRNVCRVYDMGEVDGAPYISMEYVDGEDLGSLLRRIGRLPGDKALEFARRLCAGLAAAHERGVLHRDLKPANIMIDGRGQLVIMDFGLAAVADAIAGGDIRSGTPAYMAPEQKSGREVTVRSDLYALGLVLGEMFTGQRPSVDGQLSGSAKDVDPAIEKVIQRCLDSNPARRPSSALDVARALPGGDPLAEALAAGETPSPEMVAASEDTGALSVRWTVVCFVLAIAGIIAAIPFGARTNPVLQAPFADRPEVLASKARDIAHRAGYTDAPADSEYGFVVNGTTPMFWYRQSPRDLETLDRGGVVTIADPPLAVTGMVTVLFNTRSRLTYFAGVPAQAIPPGPSQHADWTPFFEAAGLNVAEWTSAEPERIPLYGFDELAAWTGRVQESSPVERRVDAAAWKGRVVQFLLRDPTALAARDNPVSRRFGPQYGPVVFILAVVCLAALLAWRQYTRGRSDLQTAVRLAVFTLVCTFLAWLAHTHLVPGIQKVNQVTSALGFGLFPALSFGVLYLALEPFVRKRWPQSLISWVRLWNGSVRDTVVGTNLLIGVVTGVAFYAVRGAFGDEFERSTGTVLNLRGPGQVLGTAAGDIVTALGLVLGAFFVFAFLRTIFGRTWLAGAVVIGLTSLFALLGAPWLEVLRFELLITIIISVLARFGLLSMVIAAFVARVLGQSPMTTDFSAWYAGSMWTALALVAALTLWSFRVALAGRKVLSGELLDR